MAKSSFSPSRRQVPKWNIGYEGKGAIQMFDSDVSDSRYVVWVFFPIELILWHHR